MLGGGEPEAHVYHVEFRTALTPTPIINSDDETERPAPHPAHAINCVTPADVTAAASEARRRTRIKGGLTQLQRDELLTSGLTDSAIGVPNGPHVCCVQPSERGTSESAPGHAGHQPTRPGLTITTTTTNGLPADHVQIAPARCLTAPTHPTTTDLLPPTHTPPTTTTNTVAISDYLEDPDSGDSLPDTDEPRPPLTPIAYRPILDQMWPHPREDQWEQHRDYMRIYQQVRATALPNYLKARIPIKSGLNIEVWRRLLRGYHDKKVVDFLEFGWPVDFTALLPPTTATENHREDPAFGRSVETYVETELEHGALLGPFQMPPFTPWSQTSPMMTRPKKDSTNRRVIVDLSWPKPGSVNAGIRRGYYQGRPQTYKLPNIMDAADEVARAGRGCYLWSADLARAYRQLRTCPLSTPLLGIKFKGKHYTDIAPPFGCRTSSMACARTTNAVVYLLRKKGHYVQCYLDDFVGVARTLREANEAYTDFMSLTASLGLALSPSKCHPPTKSLDWLGFNISVEEMQVTIPRSKLHDVLNDCKKWMEKRSGTKKQLQKLAGRLQHIARCVEPARRFMSRIFDAIRDAPHRGSSPTTDPLRSDVGWFLQYAATSNGLVLLKTEEKEHWVIECDSSLRAGGAFSALHYYGTPYPASLTDAHTNIAHLEAINLIVAMKHLAPASPQNYKIVINTDNAASQQVLSSGAGRDPVLTACAREIWLFAASTACEIVVLHKPGRDLVLADALSRRPFDRSADVRAAGLLESLGLTEIPVSFENLFTPGL